jgi:hypothetical protein
VVSYWNNYITSRSLYTYGIEINGKVTNYLNIDNGYIEQVTYMIDSKDYVLAREVNNREEIGAIKSLKYDEIHPEISMLVEDTQHFNSWLYKMLFLYLISYYILFPYVIFVGCLYSFFNRYLTKGVACVNGKEATKRE